MYTLVICEKPDAARRIAHALGTKSFKESRQDGVTVFDAASDGAQFKVCSAIGHLYGLADATKNRSVYPVLDLQWVPEPRAARILEVISSLSDGASSLVHACDYDQEGEVIGYSILEYACGGKYSKSRRAKFSTLTDEEIRDSFQDLHAPVQGLAKAGRSRHMLDFLYGVNLSRALSQSFKASNDNKRYRNLSIGRVQGPTLAFAADRELEIRLHVPDPYWIIAAEFVKGGQSIVAHYEKPRIEKLSEARSIAGSCEGKEGTVCKVKNQKVALRPPAPFNLGDLQKEAYRPFKISPGYTLAIAERLYLDALISYPRTSSQKLPTSIGYRKIISGLSKIGSYGRLTAALLQKSSLSPAEGSKTDPAHPAIYPTGAAPRRRLGGLEFKIYDLVVKRFLATFGDPAVGSRTTVSIKVASHLFLAEGRSTTYEGWMFFYKPYGRLEQTSLPELKEGDILKNLNVAMEEKFTLPPPRFNQASLLEKMEKEQIGTKATRADIIATLFKRNYLASTKNGIEATDLGSAVMESMKAYVPSIVSTDLTRSMEKQLEQIEGGADTVSVIEYAVDRLIESLASFREQESGIGRLVTDAAVMVTQQAAMIGACPVCKSGSLMVIRSRATKKRFVGCSNYAKQPGGCNASAPLPQRGALKATGKSCKECGWPIVGVYFGRRSKQWKICINMKCPSKNSS